MAGRDAGPGCSISSTNELHALKVAMVAPIAASCDVGSATAILVEGSEVDVDVAKVKVQQQTGSSDTTSDLCCCDCDTTTAMVVDRQDGQDVHPSTKAEVHVHHPQPELHRTEDLDWESEHIAALETTTGQSRNEVPEEDGITDDDAISMATGNSFNEFMAEYGGGDAALVSSPTGASLSTNLSQAAAVALAEASPSAGVEDDFEENTHDGDDVDPAAKGVNDETHDNVSDISASSSSADEHNVGISHEWMAPGEATSQIPGEEGVNNLSSSQHMPRNRSFTICSVITNTSEHGSIRSNRENVDRLLMSGLSRAGSSIAGSDASPIRGHPMQPPRQGSHRGLEHPSNFAYTYDKNYYKAGDWLRFVPRRSSHDIVARSLSNSSNDPNSIDGPQSLGGGYGHGGSLGFGNSTGNNLNPDQYYRGFDNTRIRTGLGAHRYRGSGSGPNGVAEGAGGGGHHFGRIRSLTSHTNMHRNRHHPHFNQGHTVGTGSDLISPNGEFLGTPSTADANISLEQGATYGPYPGPQAAHHPHMHPNLISAPIDEEEGGGLDTSQHVNARKETSSPPLEIHCPPSEDNDIELGDAVMGNQNNLNLMHSYSGEEHVNHHINDHPQLGTGGAQEVRQSEADPHPRGNDVPMNIDEVVIIRPSSPDTISHPGSPSPSPPPPPEAGMHFESSLRTGGFVRPPPSNYDRSSDAGRKSQASHPHSNTLSPYLLEKRMHEASWDSKYETYACRVDQSQEDRSVEIPLFSMRRPHMRSFHFAWFTFFFAFLAWFAITPLLAEVQKSLDLTKEQIWTSSICSVAGAVVTRCIAGLFCDIYGARWMSGAVLFICGVPTIFTGAVNTAAGLSVLRLITGIGGSAFVTCQYWTCTMFTKEVAGTANALAAGWGNLGGGVAQIFVGSMLFPLFKWIYGQAGTERDPAELSWRTCCIIPGLICTAFTFIVIKYSDDSPKGNYRKRKNLGLMQKPSAMKHIKAAIHDHNTWLLLIQYGCCFGVELTTSNAAALYFKEEFELSTEAAAAVASTFGWMNLFARGLGGFLSDISNAYRGMRGRLIWQLVCFFLEGVFVMVFSKAKTLGGAITALMTFSLFVQGAEGSTFGIVPYLNPNVTGTVAGIVGAGGNAGAVIFSIMFRQMEYRPAFFWMGASTSAISLLSSFVWIKGYEGLFFQRRVKPEPTQSIHESEKAATTARSSSKQQTSNTENLEQQQQPQANIEDEGAHNQPRSYIGTDPSSISGPLSR